MVSQFQKEYKEKQVLIDAELDKLLPMEDKVPCELHKAMRYSVLAGGKRYRPMLCLAGCEAAKGPMELALPFAGALELIHTYSLVHDDLPSMDNDDLRRGRPTNHKVFGENVAILAGDALLTLAFEWMANALEVPESYRLQAISELAAAIGSQGMVGGQVADILAEAKEITPETLKYIHIHKTAKLIQVSAKIGAILGGAPHHIVSDVSAYGHFLGLAFQLTDDLLDVEGDEKKTGKAVQKDAKLQKATYPAFYGLDNTKKMVEDLLHMADQSIDSLGDNGYLLRNLTGMIQNRKS